MKTNKTFPSIDRRELAVVNGGAARSAGGGSKDLDSKLTMMLSQIGDSIKDVANNKNSSSDQMMPMMMMMMMMGGGGSSGGAVAAPPPPPPAPAPTYVRVNVRR